jgi:hypothetical protein
MTEAEANTLTVGDEVYKGAHRGVVKGLTCDECTIRWDPHRLTKGYWNTTYWKSCMAGITSPIKAPKLRERQQMKRCASRP